MKLALDIDSTIFPMLEAVTRHEDGRHIRLSDITEWHHLADLLGGVKPMFEVLGDVFTYDFMAGVGLYPGAAGWARRLHAEGHEIHVMTARPDECEADTRRFLSDQGVPFDSLRCTLVMDKAALCVQEGIGVIVDDQPQTIEDAHAAGLQVLTLAHEYNREVRERLGVPGAGSWAQLGPMVLAACQAAPVRA